MATFTITTAQNIDELTGKTGGDIWNMSKVLLIVDPGHYSGTPGKRTPAFANGMVIKEYQFNRPTATKLIQLAKQYGFETLDTMPEDKETTLEKRVSMANNAAKIFKAKNPDGVAIFVSIHYNAVMATWNGSTASGTEVFHSPGSIEGKRLATFVLNEVIKGTPQKNRGVRQESFYVIKNTTMPAILCEFGFMDDPREAALMIDENFQWECAREVIDGIRKYLGVYEEPKKEPEKPIRKLTWKEQIIMDGYDAKLITDLEKWISDPDQLMPAWAVIAVALAAKKQKEE